MSSQIEPMLCHLDRLVLRLWVAVLSISVLCMPLTARAQTDCTSYNQCAALQGEQNTKLSGNISYSFDQASLNTAFNNDQAKIQDFKNRVTAAANDWAAETGRSITAAPAGQTGNVTITANGTTEARLQNGFVQIDGANNSRRIMTFSDEFNGFSAAGRDRLASHEWGSRTRFT